MKLIIAIILLSLLLPALPSAAAAKTKSAVPEKYRDWLDTVAYIITDDEKATFMKLSNHRDRDTFISLFWNLRDPSPGTPKNEFKEEHMRRFTYAQRYFKFNSPRAGWKTDMGRIYIVIGEPDGKNQFEMDNSTYPAQIWSYYGKNRPGLPAAFRIVFYQPHGMGEYKLYDPSIHGPYDLMRPNKSTHDISPTDREGNFMALQDQHPELAKVSLSLLADESGYDFQPSLRSRELLNNVVQYPRRVINDSYATNFLKYKGRVSVDYSINYVESRNRVMVVPDPGTGLNMLHFSIRPGNLTAQDTGDGDRYYFDFRLNVALYKDDEPIFEYRKRFPYSGNKEDLLKTFFNSMIVSDFFPVPAGNYRLSVLLQNHVNKEFTYFDQEVRIPPAFGGQAHISGLVLSRDTRKTTTQTYQPFKFSDLEVVPEPSKQFGTDDVITVVFALHRGNRSDALKGLLEVKQFGEDGTYSKQYPFTLPADPDLTQTLHIFSNRLETLSAADYSLNLSLLDENGGVIDQKSEDLTVSYRKNVPRTTHLFKSIAAENRFLYFHIMGVQSMRLNRMEDAETYFRQAVNLRSGYAPLVKDFCRLLLKRKKFVPLLEMVETLKTNPNEQFHYHAVRGKGLYYLKQYNPALQHLKEANRLYDSDVDVLNHLGFAYLETGNKKEAEKVFEASLKLDDRQQNIVAILKTL